MTANGGGVETRVDTRKEDDKVFGHEIRNGLVARSEELRFGGFPGSDQWGGVLEGRFAATRRLYRGNFRKRIPFNCCGRSFR